MHPAAYQYVSEQVDGRRFFDVVEFGGRNVNGTVRDLFDGATYTSVDIAPGPGVDVVADASGFQPDRRPDCVVCCEVLEHTDRARDLVVNAVRILAPGGRLIVTAACDPRSPHSANDGGPLRDGEFYSNVHPSDLIDWMQGLAGVQVRVLPEGDVQATGHKPCG